MTIICGTDLSEKARQAAHAAAAIAQRLGAPLKLVHVLDEVNLEVAVQDSGETRLDLARGHLRELAEQLRARSSAEVDFVAVLGSAHDELVSIATAENASLLVVGSLGRQKQHRWLLGSVAERVAQSSPIPVLVVRDADRLEAWTRGERALRILVGVELEPSAKGALAWAAGLRAIGPCDINVTQVAWPPLEHARLGVPGPVPLDALRDEIREPALRDLRAWVGEMSGPGLTSFTVSPGWGRLDAHLTALATDTDADLIVVGARQRNQRARAWQRSISRGVLHDAGGNVACVPLREGAPNEQLVTAFRRVLIATDFSALANRAVPVGYGLVAPGGVVHLLHVAEAGAPESAEQRRAQLRQLIPLSAAARGVATELELVSEERPAAGIWHAANRLGVDAICMATHGRAGLTQVVLGSQAQEVVRKARQPVLLVPPQRES